MTIYVVNLASQYVTIIDSSTNTVVQTVDVRTTAFSSTFEIEFNPSNNGMYVANPESSDVVIIQTMPIANAGSDQTVASGAIVTVHFLKFKSIFKQDQTVASGAIVTLDGSGSTDAGSPPMTYQ